jgi:AraC-like DNA-binding protein
MVARPIPRHDRVLELMVGYANVLNDQKELATPELRHLVASHMHGLAVLLLGGKAEPEQPERGLRAARLRSIKNAILGKIGQQGLTLGEVARSQQISESYIRRLFAESGTSFRDFVLDARLTHAHRLLVDPRHADGSISALAFEAGFGDLSYFNRTFRRRYGATPSDVREAIWGERSG